MSRLAKDKLVVPGVSWACLSFVGNLDGGWVRPAEGAKHTEFMIKIRGAFGTKSEAEDHAKAGARFIMLSPAPPAADG